MALGKQFHQLLDVSFEVVKSEFAGGPVETSLLPRSHRCQRSHRRFAVALFFAEVNVSDLEQAHGVLAAIQIPLHGVHQSRSQAGAQHGGFFAERVGERNRRAVAIGPGGTNAAVAGRTAARWRDRAHAGA